MLGIAIIGAGELGGVLAHALAVRDAAGTITLVDETGRAAEGTALDITQSAPLAGFAAIVSGASDVAAAAGATVIVIADRFGNGEWQGDEGWLLLKRLSYLSADSVVLCAGAGQRDLVERGVRELGYARERLFGSAPEALAGAVRAIVALETNGSPSDVALTVLGVPPDHVVVPWEEVSIGGFASTRVLDEPTRRRIAARVGPLWPPGPRALAAAAAKAVAGVMGQSRQQIAAFVAPDDASGRRHRAAALPVRLGPGGIARVERPTLSVHDQVALDNAMLL